MARMGAQGQALVAWEEVPTPLLAVEILTPATATRDRGAERRLYLEAGVEESWIVDLEVWLIERWRPMNGRKESTAG